MRRTRRYLRLAAILLPVIAAAQTAGRIAVDAVFTAPTPAPPHKPPAVLRVEPIKLIADDGVTLAGWAIPGGCRCGAVVLLHPVRGNRDSMLGRARFLHGAGYDVVAFDSRGHGESGGRPTLGDLESADAVRFVDFAKRRFPDRPVSAIGVSMGAAALALGEAHRGLDAVVLEAMYAELDQAIENRLRLHLGAAGAWLARVLAIRLPLTESWTLPNLRPVDRVAEIDAPVLMIGGLSDRHTPPGETESIFSRLGGERELWLIEDADHSAIGSGGSPGYERRILTFLARHARARAAR